MSKISTMEQALHLVPTHWALVPGVDRWQENDEYVGIVKGAYVDWYQKFDGFGDLIEEGAIARRKIPHQVREAHAKWILFEQVGVHFFDSVKLKQELLIGLPQLGTGHVVKTLAKFSNEEFEKLGNLDGFKEMVNNGRDVILWWAMRMRANVQQEPKHELPKDRSPGSEKI